MDINLNAPFDARVPLVTGMTFSVWWVPETRNYTIAEIREALGYE